MRVSGDIVPSPKFAPLKTIVDCDLARFHILIDEVEGLSKVKASELDEEAIPDVTIKESELRCP